MISHFLSSIEGSATFGTIWLVIGFVLFVFVTLWAIRLKKSYVSRMEVLPLDADTRLSDTLDKVHQ